MNESYEEYKRNFSREQKKRTNLRDGKIQLVVGICFLLYTLYILPFSAGNADEIRGNEMKAGGTYDHVQIYYIKDLQLLRTKTDTDDDQIYCIARFSDRDQNDWIISFTPGNDQQLADGIQLSGYFDNEPALTVSGYFQLKPLEDLPSAADSFFSVCASYYADPDGSNMLSLNADYLCERGDNYTLKVLLRPGIPFGSLVVGLISTTIGIVLLIRSRGRKTQ